MSEKHWLIDETKYQIYVLIHQKDSNVIIISFVNVGEFIYGLMKKTGLLNYEDIEYLKSIHTGCIPKEKIESIEIFFDDNSYEVYKKIMEKKKGYKFEFFIKPTKEEVDER